MHQQWKFRVFSGAHAVVLTDGRTDGTDREQTTVRRTDAEAEAEAEDEESPFKGLYSLIWPFNGQRIALCSTLKGPMYSSLI